MKKPTEAQIRARFRRVFNRIPGDTDHERALAIASEFGYKLQTIRMWRSDCARTVSLVALDKLEGRWGG